MRPGNLTHMPVPKMPSLHAQACSGLRRRRCCSCWGWRPRCYSPPWKWIQGPGSRLLLSWALWTAGSSTLIGLRETPFQTHLHKVVRVFLQLNVFGTKSQGRKEKTGLRSREQKPVLVKALDDAFPLRQNNHVRRGLAIFTEWNYTRLYSPGI